MEDTVLLQSIKEYFEDETKSSAKTATGMMNNLGITKSELLSDKNIIKIKQYVKEQLINYCIINGVKDSTSKMLLEDYDSVFGKVLNDDISVVIVNYKKYSFEDFKKEMEQKEENKDTKEF